MRRAPESHRKAVKGVDRLPQKVIWEAKVGEQEAFVRDYVKKGDQAPTAFSPRLLIQHLLLS